MSTAENTVLKEVLGLIKQDEDKFLKLALHFYDPCFLTFRSTTGWQFELYKRYKDKPNKGSRIITFGRVWDSRYTHSHHWDRNIDMIKIFEKVTKEYWPMIKKKLPIKDTTQIMKELLARGYTYGINQDEVDYPTEYEVQATHSIPLFYPKSFKTKEEAKIAYNHWGIPNYTKINMV